MNVYSTRMWATTRLRAIERDGRRCTVARWLGGSCSAGPLHAHHIEPVKDGGAPYDIDNVGTACARHHPKWEALRRAIVRERVGDKPRCRHRHVHAEARRLCEARLARQVQAA